MNHGNWTFDTNVAENFDIIARTNIPHYESVIQKCVDVALAAFPDKTQTRIVDVGSATGYTMQKLLDAGYMQVYGVDSSKAMLERSHVQKNLILSSVFPKEHGPFDLITANWTLHFVQEREQYMRDMFESLNKNGILILTDKMESSALVHDRYHEFKISMGLSEHEIREKAGALEGVLVPYPLSWYMQTLNRIGFRNVEVIDAEWCFNTLLCIR